MESLANSSHNKTVNSAGKNLFRIFRRLTIIGLLLSIQLHLFGQPTSTCEKAKDIYSTLQSHHISPKPLDDVFSSIVFHKFIEHLDPRKILFSYDAIESLAEYEFQIDEIIKGESCYILEEIAEIYISKIDMLRSNIISMTADDITLNTPDTLHFKNISFTSDLAVNQMWKKLFKMKILLQIADKDSTITESDITKNQVQDILENMVASELCIIEDKHTVDNIEERKEGIYKDFLRALAESMDPHTAYMTMNEKNSFLESLQTETLSFGFALSPNLQGEYEISNIIPGGPAWSSNLIEERDQLMGIIKEEGKTIDANCTNIETISEHLQSSEVREVIFVIKNKVGKKIKVPLSKDFEIVEENIVQSYILEGDEKIGYIQLPSFYSSNEGYTETSNGCSDDVSRELIRLQQEQIDGLILDLRFNGGGSIFEAIKMSGMFINYGPIAIAEYKDKKPETLKDMDRGLGYRGPLTILVNSFSASASELFAGAMQDYNRAIIVGTPTHGKGSIQTVMPSNAHAITEDSSPNDISSDFVKTTIGKYYRITGKGVQNVGIEPDILIPDIYDLDVFKERDNQLALTYSTIDKKTYYKPMKALPIEELRTKSALRIADNNDFVKTNQLRQELLSEQTNAHLILELENLRALQKENKYDFVTSPTEQFIVSLPAHKKKLLQQDKYQIKQSEIARVNLLKDPQLTETYQVLTELISTTK